MLDLDRVEMILPQVHLRNGEESAEIIHLTTQAPTMLRRSRVALQGGISPSPSSHTALLSQGTDWILGGVYTSHTTPTLTVSERSPGNVPQALRCGLPIVASKTLLPSERALPSLLHALSQARRGSRWL